MYSVGKWRLPAHTQYKKEGFLRILSIVLDVFQNCDWCPGVDGFLAVAEIPAVQASPLLHPYLLLQTSLLLQASLLLHASMLL